MKFIFMSAVILLAACSNTGTNGVIPGGKPFELDERLLQPCAVHQQMPGLVNPNDILQIHAADAKSDAYCRDSRSSIIQSYREYRKSMSASEPVDTVKGK